MAQAGETAAQHVLRTLRALELFADGPLTQAELADQLEVHRRTARRLIARLAEEGYLEPNETGKKASYLASPRMVVLGSRVAAGLNVPAIGRKHLDAIGSEGIQDRFVAVRTKSGLSLETTDERERGKRPRGALELATTEFHASAAGKVFLSEDNDLLDGVLHQKMIRFTEATISTRADLLVELAKVRADGYAMEDREHRADRRAAAAAVIDHAGRNPVALVVTAPKMANLAFIGQAVAEAALSCSRAIGGLVEPLGTNDEIDTLT